MSKTIKVASSVPCYKQFAFLKEELGLQGLANTFSNYRYYSRAEIGICTQFPIEKSMKGSQMSLGFVFTYTCLSIMFIFVYSCLTRIHQGHGWCGFCKQFWRARPLLSHGDEISPGSSTALTFKNSREFTAISISVVLVQETESCQYALNKEDCIWVADKTLLKSESKGGQVRALTLPSVWQWPCVP